MTFQLMRVKHRRLFASFHWGLFCKQDWICRPIKSKERCCAVYIGSDRNGATHRLWVEHVWANHSSCHFTTLDVFKTISPKCIDGWVETHNIQNYTAVGVYFQIFSARRP